MASIHPQPLLATAKEDEQALQLREERRTKRKPYFDIVILFLLTRLALIAVTYLGYILLTADKYSSTPVDLFALLNTWNRWDATNYIEIAQYGYQTASHLAFFPLFPLLIASMSFVLGSWSYLLVGTVMSNLALLGTLFLLYELAIEIVGEQAAQRTLFYLCIFPTAFYFFAAYNESLFLFFVVGTFLALRRQRWGLAGLLGLLAALTRSAGILLVLPFLYEAWQTRDHTQHMFSQIFKRIIAALMIPLGTLLYAIYCWVTIKNPLAFITVQDSYGRHLNFPWRGLWQAIIELLFVQPFGSANQAHLLLDGSATVGFLFLLLLGWKKLPKSFSLWTGILLLYVLLDPATDKPDILLSNQRFVLEMFPAFITLGILGTRHPRLHQALVIVFPSLLATLSILFIMNRWLV